MSQPLLSTPQQDGFRMPAEFETHAGSWMLWPERPDNWREDAKPAQSTFAAVAAAISQFEPITMGVSETQLHNARRMLPPAVRVVEIASNDSWMRDCGPTFVTNDREIRTVDWIFNAWGGLKGGLYSPWDLDDQVASKVAEMVGVQRYRAPLVLEGGSIHTDGQGTLLTTEECLLNKNRNPELTKAQIEKHLRDYLNVEKIIWLKRGVFNDETSGHVDNICCFLHPGVVALSWTEDKNDPQYEISQECYEILKSAVDARGRALEVHKIHQPDPIIITEEESRGVKEQEGTLPRQAGTRLAGSYINFYFVNSAVIVPVFDDTHDAAALAKLRKLLPERKIIAIPAREILLGGGNIHCITQQQPAVGSG